MQPDDQARNPQATHPASQTTDDGESEAIARFHGHGWFNIWGVLLAIFLGSVGVCVYSLLRPGTAEDNYLFGYAIMLAAFIGICLIGRWSVTGLLLGSSTVDKRNVRLMAKGRRGMRW